MEDVFPFVLLHMLSHIMNPIFWLVIALIAFQYRRIIKTNEHFFGLRQGKWWQDTLHATGLGIVGGVFGSFVMVFVGLTLSGSGLQYIWPVAILLLLIDPRFICFAYAGGILAFTSLVFGWPQISVPQVLALVAILHMVESVLIYVSGHLGAVPAYIRTGERVVGGYILQRFWPIPIVALLILGQDVPVTGQVNMPDWWPLIKPALDVPPESLIYVLFPVVAGLGYGDVVAARTPKQKAGISAKNLFLYSVILLVLAVLADKYYIVGVMGALFSPLGHEMLIYLGKRMELTDSPNYVPVHHGLKLLDVIPGTPAWRVGLRSGDVIIELNDLPVRNKASMEYLLQYTNGQVEIAYFSQQNQRYCRQLVKITPGVLFGIINVPEGHENPHFELTTQNFVSKWLKKIKP